MGVSLRRVWAGCDALILAYLLVRYDWSFSLGWAGSWLLFPVEVLLGFGKLLFVGGCIALGILSIGREFRRDPDFRPFPLRSFALPLCLTACLAAAALWLLVWTGLTGSETRFAPPDAFGLITAACRRPAERTIYGLLGLFGYQRASAGGFLLALLAASYLAEKYFRLAWRAGRPRGPFALIPVVPVLLLVIAVGAAVRGEQAKRSWIRAQQWAVQPGVMTFPEAVSACERHGPGWRLPSEVELAEYLGSAPVEVRDLQDKAWTNLLADAGAGAVVVAFAPPVRGASPYRCGEETHDPAWLVPGAFSRFRGWTCGWLGSPVRHPASRAPLAVIRAVVVEPVRLPAVCLRSSDDAPPAERRPDAQEVAIANARQWTNFLQQRCGVPNRPAATCAAFAEPDSPVGSGVGMPFLALEQQFDAAVLVFEGMVVMVRTDAGRPHAQIAVGRYLKGDGPLLVEMDGLPPEVEGLTPRDRLIFFANSRGDDGVLRAAPDGAMVEITPDTITALGRKLGPGGLPPFLAGLGRRGPRLRP